MKKDTKIQSLLLTLLLALSLLPACSGANEKPAPAAADLAKQKEQIKATLNDMWEAIEKGDVERYASYIHPDFTQWGETARNLRVGKKAEVRAIKEWIEEPTRVHTEMRDPRVTIRGETAWITYYWEDEGTSGGEPFATKGKSTRIFVRENGRWLCIHGHYTLLEDEN